MAADVQGDPCTWYADLRAMGACAASRGDTSAVGVLRLRGGVLLDDLPPRHPARCAHWRSAADEDLLDPALLAMAREDLGLPPDRCAPAADDVQLPSLAQLAASDAFRPLAAWLQSHAPPAHQPAAAPVEPPRSHTAHGRRVGEPPGAREPSPSCFPAWRAPPAAHAAVPHERARLEPCQAGAASAREEHAAWEHGGEPPSMFVSAARKLRADEARGRGGRGGGYAEAGQRGGRGGGPPGLRAALDGAPEMTGGYKGGARPGAARVPGLQRRAGGANRPFVAPTLHKPPGYGEERGKGYGEERSYVYGEERGTGYGEDRGRARACGGGGSHPVGQARAGASEPAEGESAAVSELMEHEALRGVDAKLVEQILNEIVDRSPGVGWDAIAGLQFAKQSVREITVLPLLRPDIFRGARQPPKGLLLFGPPGTGKTLIAKAIATDSSATFFSISASSLMSKWMGEGEKMVRALFAVARAKQPSVIFIDEVDSILSQRREGEQEGTIRVKNEILVQMDGASAGGVDERVLVVGATNRPQELDDAARRRLQKRLLIPLPDAVAREQMLTRGLRDVKHTLAAAELAAVVSTTEGYSGSDMTGLCREAAMGPCRDPGVERLLLNGELDELRSVCHADFVNALTLVRASVSAKELEGFEEWNKLFGSFSRSTQAPVAGPQ